MDRGLGGREGLRQNEMSGSIHSRCCIDTTGCISNLVAKASYTVGSHVSAQSKSSVLESVFATF